MQALCTAKKRPETIPFLRPPLLAAPWRMRSLHLCYFSSTVYTCLLHLPSVATGCPSAICHPSSNLANITSMCAPLISYPTGPCPPPLPSPAARAPPLRPRHFPYAPPTVPRPRGGGFQYRVAATCRACKRQGTARGFAPVFVPPCACRRHCLIPSSKV